MSNLSATPRTAPPAAGVLALILFGALLALAGGYWDDAWHTTRGRDAFLIAPHLAIYGGISAAGAALGLWAVRGVRNVGLGAALTYPPLALAIVAIAVTLLSAPVDNAWHLAFGRDAVIWSPPHTLGIVGTASLAFALLLELSNRAEAHPRQAVPVAGALALTALGFLVVEYETDVPQFGPEWYLPVLATGSAFALGQVRLLGERPFAATEAAFVHLGLIAAVAGFLLLLGFDAPALPLLVVPAAVLDYLWRRGVGLLLTAGVYAAALIAVYAIAGTTLPGAVPLARDDLLVSVPVVVVGTGLALSLAGLPPRRARPLAGTATACVLTWLTALALAAPAVAHDPGQGEPAGNVSLALQASDRRVALRGLLPGRTCRATGDGDLVARRAGRTFRSPLQRRGCQVYGAIEVPETGRWFVYLDLATGRGQRLESWLPIDVAQGRSHATERSRYAYLTEASSGGWAKTAVGAALYAGVVTLFAATAMLSRRAAAERGRLRRSASGELASKAAGR